MRTEIHTPITDRAGARSFLLSMFSIVGGGFHPDEDPDGYTRRDGRPLFGEGDAAAIRLRLRETRAIVGDPCAVCLSLVGWGPAPDGAAFAFRRVFVDFRAAPGLPVVAEVLSGLRPRLDRARGVRVYRVPRVARGVGGGAR